MKRPFAFPPLFLLNITLMFVIGLSISLSLSHSLACFLDKGDLFMWGKNKGGSLGNGKADVDLFFPMKVKVMALEERARERERTRSGSPPPKLAL